MSKKKRGEKHRKLIVSEDISHMGITEEEYKIIEDSLDPSLNVEEKPSIQCTKKGATNNKYKKKPKSN